MSDPRRLLTDGSEFERDLIAAGVADAPQARSVRRVAAALGVGAATLGTAGVATGATAVLRALPSAVPAALPAGGGATSAVGGLGVVKWVSIVALTVATAGSMAYVASSRAPMAAGSATAPSDPQRRMVSPPVAAPAPSTLQTDRKVDVSPANPIVSTASVTPPAGILPSPLPAPLGSAGAPMTLVAPPEAVRSAANVAEPVPSAQVADTALARASAPDAVSSSSLTAETSALDAARVALHAREPEGTLRALDAYDAAFPNGMLAQEAMVLRIELASSVGNRAAVRRLADAFLVRHPESPLRPRVRAIVASMSNP